MRGIGRNLTTFAIGLLLFHGGMRVNQWTFWATALAIGIYGIFRYEDGCAESKKGA